MEKLEPLLLTPDQVKELTGWGRSKIYKLIQGQVLPVVREGRGVRIPRQALLNWITERTTAASIAAAEPRAARKKK